MIAPEQTAGECAQDDERSAAERLLTELLIAAAPDPDALALRRVLAGWVTRRP